MADHGPSEGCWITETEVSSQEPGKQLGKNNWGKDDAHPIFCGICNKEIGFHLFDPPLLTFEIMLINLFWIWTYFIVYISDTYTIGHKF